MACVLAVLISLPSRPLSAQRSAADTSAEASALFREGMRAYRDGQTETALELMQRAYRAAPNYRALYNIGQVLRSLGRLVEAMETFERYLSEGDADLPARRRREVAAMIAELDAQLATLRVVCAEGAATVLPIDCEVQCGADVRLVPGTYEVRYHGSTSSVALAAGERRELAVNATSLSAPERTPEVPEHTTPVVQQDAARSRREVGLWTTGGVASALVAAAAVALGSALSFDATLSSWLDLRPADPLSIERVRADVRAAAAATDVLSTLALLAGVGWTVALVLPLEAW